VNQTIGVGKFKKKQIMKHYNFTDPSGVSDFNKKTLESNRSGNCPKCGHMDSKPSHTCPFQVDINSDRDFLCNCCLDCQIQCAQEI
jgi:hypothetical protein